MNETGFSVTVMPQHKSSHGHSCFLPWCKFLFTLFRISWSRSNFQGEDRALRDMTSVWAGWVSHEVLGVWDVSGPLRGSFQKSFWYAHWQLWILKLPSLGIASFLSWPISFILHTLNMVLIFPSGSWYYCMELKSVLKWGI